jgi:hypothetical protein
MQHSPTVAAGLSVPVTAQSGFAATQAVWRFLANDKVTLPRLIDPLRQFAKQQIIGCYVLQVLDWCKLKFDAHSSKKDRITDSLKYCNGYELTTQLAVDADNGSPIAVVQAHLKTSNGFLSTMDKAPDNETPHLEQVLPMMKAAHLMHLGAKSVFVIDREADALYYLRQWHAAGKLFLIRGDDDRRADWNEESVSIREIKEQADKQQMYIKSRDVIIKGKECEQFIFETKIILSRPAQHRQKNKRSAIAGEPLPLRLVIAKVLDQETHEE